MAHSLKAYTMTCIGNITSLLKIVQLYCEYCMYMCILFLKDLLKVFKNITYYKYDIQGLIFIVNIKYRV